MTQAQLVRFPGPEKAGDSPVNRADTAAPPEEDAKSIKEVVSWYLDHDQHDQLWVFDGCCPTPMRDDVRSSVNGAVSIVRTALSGAVPEQLRASTIEMAYQVLLATFCTSRYGLPTNWPDGFWDSTIGRYLYVAFWEAYGEALMLNQEVTRVLGIDLSRVGQVQRLGLLRYIENPWVLHRKQKRRRVTPAMAQRYLEEQRLLRETGQGNPEAENVPAVTRQRR